jgi:membrane protease YdiL (CAAX protease family)
MAEFNFIHHAIVFSLIVLFPIWDRHETKYLKTTTDPDARRNGYRKTIAWQIVAVIILLLTIPPAVLYHAPTEGRTLAGRAGHLVIPIAIGLSAGFIIPLIIGWIKPETRTAQAKQLDAIRFFLPQTATEKQWFAAMCLVVGICEEVIFRGFLIRYVMSLPLHVDIIPATVIAAVIFGIDHGYQGIVGILSTAVLALVFTLIFFATGSLLVPMLVHALIDLRILVIASQPTTHNT